MKTLHSIFHDRLIFKWVRFLITGILGVAGVIIFAKLQDSLSWSDLGIFLSGVLILISSVGIFFVNNHYPRNIKWLINQNYNRKDLMIFFFSSQSLKLILSLITILVLLFSTSIYEGLNSKVLSLFDFSKYYSYAEMFSFSVFFIGFIYVLYIPVLFSANTNEILQSQMKKSLYRNSKREVIFILIFFFLVFINLLSNFSVPSLFLYFLGLLFICVSVFLIINRTFKLYTDNKAYKIASIIGALCIVPTLIFTFLMLDEVKNKDISYEYKKPSVLMLDRLVTDYSSQDMLEFLKLDLNYLDFKSMLNIFKENLDVDLVLNSINSNIKVRGLMDFYAKELPIVEVKRIVSFMDQYIEKGNEGNSNFFLYSHSFFIKQKVPKEYIDSLVISASSYKQLAGVYFAKNVMKKDEFKQYIEENGNILSTEVLKSKFLIKELGKSN